MDSINTILSLLFFLFNYACPIRLGSISNAIYVSSNINPTYFDINCMQCNCLALRLNAVGWNCNDRCQIIMEYSLDDMGLIQSNDTTFSLLTIPPKRPTTTKTSTTTESTTATTTTATTTSTTSTTTTITALTTTESTTAITTTSTTTESATTSTTTTTLITTTSTTTESTTTTTLTTTIQSLHSAQIASSSAAVDDWKMYSYSYLASNLTAVTFKFIFQATVNYGWYLDDVSICDSNRNERLTNEKFDNSPSLTGWSQGHTGICLFNYGLTTSKYYSASNSFYSLCSTGLPWVSQSLTVTNGQIYNVSFWLYLNRILPLLSFGAEQVTVTIE